MGNKTKHKYQNKWNFGKISNHKKLQRGADKGLTEKEYE